MDPSDGPKKIPIIIKPDDSSEETVEVQTSATPGAAQTTLAEAGANSGKADIPKEMPTVEEAAPAVIEASNAAQDSAQETTDKKHHSFFRPEIILPKSFQRKLGDKARLVSILIILIILGAGGFGTWKLTASRQPNKPKVAVSSFKLSVVPFKLVSTVPAKNASNINTASDIVLNFSQPVNPDKLINNMFLTPKVDGTFKQGDASDQVIFKPATPFMQGTKVSVMINGTVQSVRGSKLGAPYAFDFSTSIPNDEVVFQDQNGLIDQVASLASGQKEVFTLAPGNSVSANVTVTLYKGDTGDLLNSLVYTDKTTDGATSPSFSDLSVPTDGLQKVSSQANIANNATYNVQEPDGLYVAVATDSTGKEVGFVWVDFSKFGVLLRQDDQKVVLDAQLFSNSQEIPAHVNFYNLNSSVNLLGQQTVDGLTTAKYPFSPSLDLVVATYSGETAIIPINVLNSGGDIRVDQDLSTAQQVYGITDKPTYKIGETLHYAGFVRDDNDAQYTNPANGEVSLYVARYRGDTPLVSFNAPLSADGEFSGSTVVQGNWLTSGDAFDQLQIFAVAVDGNSNDDIPVASFSVTNQTNPSSNVQVSFTQSDYLPNNTISANITATNSNGQPLANTTVDVHTFSQDYYENDPALDLAEFGYTGAELPNSPVTVKLNANGEATYTINPSSLPNDGNSQMVTVQANLTNQSGVGAAGGDSAIVHQGDGTLTFGLGRTNIPQGSDLSAPIYANHLNGNPMSSTNLSYQLVDTNNSSKLATGSVTTDSSGYAVVDIPSSKLNNNDSMQLIVSATDEDGNVVQANNYYYVTTSENGDTSGAELQDLDVTGSSGNVNVGDTVNLTINSPANIRAMFTMDRGRIYNPSMVSLNKGNNTYSFTVTAMLAPSFTLTFNYFLNGVYHSEGVPFNVSESAQVANVKLTSASQSVTADKQTSVQINTTDSDNNPLQTTLIAEVVSSNAYDLTSQTAPSIFETLFNARPIMTSSSSSLSPVGSGGGGCGGGGGDLPSFANALATTLFWQPGLVTSSSGQATINFTPPSGSWTVNVYAMSGNTQVGFSSTTIDAK